jgi:hypothetical protein
LGCYNGGELNGAWVAGTVAGDVSRALKVKLGEPAIYGQNCLVCVKCGSDEFNVFDHENYGGLLSGECDPMTAQRMAELWEELEESNNTEELRAYAANLHLSLSDLGSWRDDFENAYVGTYGTWRSGFYCLSKQGLTLTSTFMQFPVWFWVVFITASLSILLTKILGRG